MKLSVYLMRPNVTDFHQVILDRYLHGEQPYIEVRPLDSIDFECTAYIQATKEKTPKWLSFLEDGFNLEDFSIVNTSNSFVLLVKSGNRVFAFTFGYGYSAVDKGLIESGFGLRVTLNSIGETSLDTLDTRNVDMVTRQTRTHISLSSPIYEFGINTTMDWIRYASGKPDGESPATRYSGSDSLQVSFDDLQIGNLGLLCNELLEQWESEDYKSRFPFIDYLRKISREDSIIQRLNNELRQKITLRSHDKIALAHPEIPNQETDSHKIWLGWDHVITDELDLNDVYSFLDGINQNVESAEIGIDDVNIIAIDSDGNPKSQKRTIRDYIVCEVELDGKRYIHSLNEWFIVAVDYMDEIKNKVRLLESSSTIPVLPKIRNGEAEGVYNHRASEELDYLLLDKQAFTFNGYRNRIESCDLATNTGDLIAVKKMTSSATLSHLFAQGSVSAKLLKLDTRYKDVLRQKLQEKWADFNLPEESMRFVFAIPSKKAGSLADTMFFFSMVNLVDHVETIKLAGFEACISKIEYE